MVVLLLVAALAKLLSAALIEVLTRVAALAAPNGSPPPVALSKRFRPVWALWNFVFHAAAHVFCTGGRAAQASLAQGKWSEAITLVEAIARTALSDIGRPPHCSLRHASSCASMYFGMPAAVA